jgi:predicted neuraminidase
VPAAFESRLIYETIPGAPSAHASTVCELTDGRLMAAWYAGTHEGHDDVAVYGAYLRVGAEAWSAPIVLEKTPGVPEGNPVLHPTADGGVTLIWATMYERRWTGCRIRIRESLIRGGERVWGPDRAFAPELGLMTRNKPLVLSNGDLLLPLYDERKWCSFLAWSTDGGRTWERSADLVSRPGNIQPSVAELRPGELVALMRCGDPPGSLWRSRSSDYGRTWSPLEPTGIPNPDAGADLVGLASGRIALVYNDSRVERTPLTVALSEDGGESFPSKRNLEVAPGEYSYPAVIQAHDGRIHVTYTYRRETIKHVSFTEDWVLSR